MIAEKFSTRFKEISLYSPISVAWSRDPDHMNITSWLQRQDVVESAQEWLWAYHHISSIPVQICTWKISPRDRTNSWASLHEFSRFLNQSSNLSDPDHLIWPVSIQITRVCHDRSGTGDVGNPDHVIQSNGSRTTSVRLDRFGSKDDADPDHAILPIATEITSVCLDRSGTGNVSDPEHVMSPLPIGTPIFPLAIRKEEFLRHRMAAASEKYRKKGKPIELASWGRSLFLGKCFSDFLYGMKKFYG